jgi:prophage tail gpP-like protein
MADVELRTAGKIFAGWTTININRSIESLSGYFELGVNVQPETDLSSLSPGQLLPSPLMARRSLPVISMAVVAT